MAISDQNWDTAIARINSLRFQLVNSAGLPYRERTQLFLQLKAELRALEAALDDENEDVPH